ncbi:caspase family protein [Rhodopseudomonas sp. BR0M22]|uniref:caspase family protein n=1 Tax=Rhodopseudomonas sp. BR0M22 TaxID=2269369 RepID=UPI0013DEE252|nr:caspase family protein [Rhodopseudomonas sp. BR0M22]NEW95053.1 caspase family protein [Rhodopseudomonas sp. BR0M22]
MKIRLHRFSRRTLTAVAALVGVVSLGIGAHAALNKRPVESARAASPAAQEANASSSRLALVIGNGHYPDAAAPLAQPINDARALSAKLRGDGYDVDMIEDASRDDILRAVGRLKARARKDATVMLFFGGYGIQSGRDNYMVPVDAKIWTEADVRRSGVSVEQVLAEIKAAGASTSLAVLDASRRNPYERRFRAYSHGLAPIETPANALVLSSATPGQVADDNDAPNSMVVAELIGSLSSPASAEAAFAKARQAVIKATSGAQVPSMTSSLVTDVPLVPVADASPGNGG